MLHSSMEGHAAAHEIIIFKIRQFCLFYLMNDIVVSDLFECIDGLHGITSVKENFAICTIYYTEGSEICHPFGLPFCFFDV